MASLVRMIILGAPGAGKGTHSARLVERFGFKMIGMGDILRGDVTPEVQQALANGALLPDDTVMKVATPHLHRFRRSSWILDGLPRNRRQADLLDDLLGGMRTPLNLVVALRVPDEAILERIENRWIHKASGRVYNTTYNPPRVAGKDDVTGESLEKRSDDTREVFGKRLRHFHKENEPMLEHYRKQTTDEGRPKVVELFGETSDIIWPQLEREVLSRFPRLEATR